MRSTEQYVFGSKMAQIAQVMTWKSTLLSKNETCLLAQSVELAISSRDLFQRWIL